MYPLKPLKVYAHTMVRDDPRCIRRMERMLGAMEPADSEVVWVDDGNMADVAKELETLWPPPQAPEGTPLEYTRPVVFTNVFTGEELPSIEEKMRSFPEGTPGTHVQSIMGYFNNIQPYHPFEKDQAENRVCWPTWDFATMLGCPHGCRYCGTGTGGRFFTVALNIEQFMDEVVPRTAAKFPWQKCFRMIGWGADMIAFEPEYGVFDLYTKKLAELDLYGYFHAASSNVEWIADLERKDRLIGIFSVTCEAVARDIEPGTGHAFDRFDAGAKLEAMGVPFRYKFKPMIPVRNWREEYARAIEYAMSVSHPESVGFCVIMWMSLETLAAKIDLELLDPEFVQAARDAAAEMEGNVCAPFPHHVRKEIYRHLISEVRRWSKDTKLFLSTESREMWDELAEEMGQDPRYFLCGCSPVAPPGGKLTLSKGCPHSTYKPLDNAAPTCGQT